MKKIRRLLLGFCGLTLALFLVACGGLPGELKKKARAKADHIEEALKRVEEERAEYLEFKETGKFEFFNLYAGRERWEDRFTEADDELTRAREEIFDKSIKRLLDLNDEKKATKLKMEISRVDRAIKTAIQKAREPKARMAELVRVKEEAPELVDAAAAAMGEINAII
ncbi:MAG: hypothetical protein GY859_37425, partial [Desulfobacterales bacterium]|nr:hypothetical protein [Desulfobacterales bacterium]